MKYIITGRHCGGKHEVLDLLDQKFGVKVAREFCTIPKEDIGNVYIDEKYQVYSQDDVSNMFNSGGYICMTTVEDNNVLDSYTHYRGISFYDFDLADVMVMYPSEVVNINKKQIRDDICFVWMDGNIDSRIHRFSQENRPYHFAEIENQEAQYDNDFTRVIYGFGCGVMYFNNEIPERVACILNACIQHPDLHDSFIENYN